ncbi:aspartate aminotransferase family protein, partial [Bacillus cereus]|nr:aspartate aminotransferase family protein [Bacillus cereus]
MKIAGRNLSHHGTSAAFVKNKLLWKVEVMMKTKQTDELLAKDEQYVWHGMRPF